jgi:hypothetical protein
VSSNLFSREDQGMTSVRLAGHRSIAALGPEHLGPPINHCRRHTLPAAV